MLTICVFCYIGLSTNCSAKCHLADKIKSIHDGLHLLDQVTRWSNENQLNVSCYYEIGKGCFFLFVKQNEPVLLKKALDYLAFSVKNLSKNDPIYTECYALNAYLGFLYQFRPVFLNCGYEPVTYFINELAEDCLHYNIRVEKNKLLQLTHIMKNYYQAEKEIKQDPSPDSFEKMFDILADIKSWGLQNVSDMREAYKAWQQYFEHLTDTHKMHCNSFEKALTALSRAKKELLFVKDNRSACGSFVNCRFYAFQDEVRKQISQRKTVNLQRDCLNIWQNYYQQAQMRCKNESINPVPEIKQDLFLMQQDVDQLLNQHRTKDKHL